MTCLMMHRNISLANGVGNSKTMAFSVHILFHWSVFPEVCSFASHTSGFPVIPHFKPSKTFIMCPRELCNASSSSCCLVTYYIRQIYQQSDSVQPCRLEGFIMDQDEVSVFVSQEARDCWKYKNSTFEYDLRMTYDVPVF